MKLDRNRILDLWAAGKTAPEIAEIIGHPNRQAVSGLVCIARKAGDVRAVARLHHKKSVAEAPETPPVTSKAGRSSGIEITTRIVPNRAFQGVGEIPKVAVSLPRLRCLEVEVA